VDGLLNSLPGLRGVADHVLLTFRRVPQ
jgi:hypothetical protein